MMTAEEQIDGSVCVGAQCKSFQGAKREVDMDSEDPTVTLREIHARMESIEQMLGKLTHHVERLIERLDRAENTNLQTMHVPRDFNAGPHLPGLG
jgi:hypothetical protein